MNLKELNRVVESKISSSYDTYFAGGDNSIYNKRFGKNRLLPREKHMVIENAKVVLKRLDYKTKKHFTIVDYGCGNGRYSPAFIEFAQHLKKYNITLNVISYDPSLIGLECYGESLKEMGFKSLEINSIGKSHSNYERDNLVIKLVHGDVDYSPEIIESILGGEDSVDLLLCMFGTMSHIPGRKNRVDIINVFEKLIHEKGRVFISVPTQKDFREELQAYNTIRAQRAAMEVNGDATIEKFNSLLSMAQEEGDLYYCRSDAKKSVENYYHIYRIKELHEDAIAANLNIKEAGIASISHPSYASQNLFKSVWDELLSKILSKCPDSFIEKYASYISLIADKNM